MSYALISACTGKKQLKFSVSSNFNTLFRLGIVSLLTFRPGKTHSLVRSKGVELYYYLCLSQSSYF